MRKHSNNSKSGVTLVEIMLSATLLAIISATMLESLARFQEAGKAISKEFTLERRSSDVAMRITKDLGRSGFAVVDEQQYPMIMSAGQGASFSSDFSHDTVHSQKGESDELIFCLPEDLDGDGWPDIQGNKPSWSSNRVSYFLRPSSNNRNVLIRAQQGGRQEVVCRGVARFELETPAQTGYEIPLDSIRMTLTLSAENGGQQFEKTTQEVIQLRNGGLAP